MINFAIYVCNSSTTITYRCGFCVIIITYLADKLKIAFHFHCVSMVIKMCVATYSKPSSDLTNRYIATQTESHGLYPALHTVYILKVSKSQDDVWKLLEESPNLIWQIAIYVCTLFKDPVGQSTLRMQQKLK